MYIKTTSNNEIYRFNTETISNDIPGLNTQTNKTSYVVRDHQQVHNSRLIMLDGQEH